LSRDKKQNRKDGPSILSFSKSYNSSGQHRKTDDKRNHNRTIFLDELPCFNDELVSVGAGVEVGRDVGE
jgi:hypothetical protein